MQRITVTAKDGTAINAEARNFEQGSIKGIVVISHGFGEHGAMYAEVAETLGQAGYACLLFDQRGHGAPPGMPPELLKKHFGVTPSYECLLDDIVSVTVAARQMAPDAPVALYGHSMGGNIVINTLLRDPGGYSCAVLEAPWLGLYKEQNPLIVGFARVAGKLSPGLATVNKLKPEVLTSIQERMEAYISDPLYHGRISFRLFTGVKNGCANALKNAPSLSIPLFLAYAENDTVLSSEAALRFAEGAGDAATVRGYDSRHAIHNDKDRDRYFSDVIAFLDKYCK